MAHLSKRLLDIVEALPLKEGLRVLEIGCGSGAAAREIARRIGDGYILGIDRSSRAIQQAKKGSRDLIQTGQISFRNVSIEKFQLDTNEKLFDLAFAVRVGVLDGRHPEGELQALTRIAKSLTKHGKLYIDGGDPLIELPIDNYRR